MPPEPLSLDDGTRWATLTHAYGSAADIPPLLRALEAFPPCPRIEDEPWFSLWSALAHQGDVYPATFAAVPHVVRILASDVGRAEMHHFGFPAWVEICRCKGDVPVPEELAPAYRAAIAALPGLVAESAAVRDWDEAFVVVALSAVAIAKGHVMIGEFVQDLTPKAIRRFQAWQAG